MAVTASTERSERLQRNQLSLFGVIMPGLAQVAPAFNLFFTTGVMVGLAGASAPLIFLISMVAMGATASSLAQFSGVYPSAGSFITYITRAIGTKVAVATGVICVLGYIIAFGGIYIFVGSVHFWGVTQLVTILYGVLVVAPVVVGLKFGVRVTVALYVFEVVLLLALSLTILFKGGASGLSGTPFTWPGGKASARLRKDSPWWTPISQTSPAVPWRRWSTSRPLRYTAVEGTSQPLTWVIPWRRKSAFALGSGGVCPITRAY